MTKIKHSKTFLIGIFLLLIITTSQISLIFNTNIFNENDIEGDNNKIENEKSPKTSAKWGTINITSFQLNHTKRYQNETIKIEGSLKYLNGTGINDTKVGVFVNDSFVSYDFTNDTNVLGNFQINFRIPYSLTIYDPAEYEIQVNITDEALGLITKNNSFFIRIVPWGEINLTNYAINDTTHYHNETIVIEGRLWEYNKFDNGLENYNVSLYINGDKRPEFNDTTDVGINNGTFQINFKIPSDLDISQNHIIEVNVTHGTWIYDVIRLNNFIITIVPRARLTLTNNAFYNSRYYYGTEIPIKGKIYEFNDYNTGIQGINVELYIDGQLTGYDNDTDSNGEFIINYAIPLNLDISQGHRVEVNVTQTHWINETIKVAPYFFTLDTNATTDLTITGYDSGLKVPGEEFNIQGYLRYGNYLSGAGIPSANINYFWYNSSFSWSINTFTSDVNGSISERLRIPNNVYSPTINLKIYFLGNSTNLDSSQVIISNIRLFSNITCNWNFDTDATVGSNITILGQIVSTNNNSLWINNRTLSILYDGDRVGSVNTDENGDFTFTYAIPTGIGNKSIQVELLNSAGVILDSTIILNVTAESRSSTRNTDLPPGLIFSLVFFPILIGIITGLAVYGYRRYKKQEKKSRVVTVELDPKFLNLKILKETERLEESLSYLFNAIFMSLIEAKYGRTREENETIRDFAIVSVKELKLTPAAIYPFIQKVEAIIYGKPFKITENEFYKTCELFSPLYFELTGNNFILNF